MSKKEIIFFDGDGTIWYPRKTKWKVPPYWIYSDKTTAETYLEHLILTPRILAVLKKLKRKGIILVLISTHPHRRKEADLILDGKLRYFKLDTVFHDFYSARPRPEGKGQKIAEVLRKKNIPKSRALMVGDSYQWDYLSARKVGVDALLIKTAYSKNGGRKVPTIATLSALPALLE